MKKSLLLSATSVAGAAALVGGMTIAAFNDTETASFPSPVVAGSLELDQKGLTMPLLVDNMKPGDHADFTIKLENEGTLPGVLYGMLAEVKGIEDGCEVRDGLIDLERVEAQVDGDCGNVFSGGDLEQYLEYEFVLPGGQVVPATETAEVGLGGLDGSTEGSYVLRVRFRNDPMADKWVVQQQNDAQGDGAVITLKFALVQS